MLIPHDLLLSSKISPPERRVLYLTKPNGYLTIGSPGRLSIPSLA